MTNTNISASNLSADPLSALADSRPDSILSNWAGNIAYSTSKIYYPQTVEEVQELIKRHHKIKALGTRHCFNRIADSQDNLLSTKNLNKVIALDTKAHTVTVEGGIKYGELAPYLHEKGYALPNMASLPHISVAGSIITATHGSGVRHGNLATSVSALEIVTADGQVHTVCRDKNEELFYGAVVSLGALGIITKVTLDLQPTFMMRQYVYENLPLDQLKTNFEEIVSAGYSVSLFTDWRSNNLTEVWIKTCENATANFEAIPEFYGAKAATQNLHPIIGLPAENCTGQMGLSGPWYDRLPHFKMGFTPSSGVELQSEYFVARRHAVEAILAVARLGELISPHLFVSEIRTIAADQLWLSPCYNQPTVALHFTWKPDWPVVSKLLPLLEKELAPFNARPHWGKLFTMSPEMLASCYEKLPDFKKLASAYDPQGKFRNDFLNTII